MTSITLPVSITVELHCLKESFEYCKKQYDKVLFERDKDYWRQLAYNAYMELTRAKMWFLRYGGM